MKLTPSFRKALGDYGEELAARFLEGKGYKIIEKKYRIIGGEIDIIALDENETLVFIEVKTRTFDYARKYGRAYESVNKSKMGFVTHTASNYIKKNFRYSDYEFRFDVVEVYVPDDMKDDGTKKKVYIDHIKDAFQPTKRIYRRKD